MSAQPYLSVVMTGRNDDHGGSFVRRFLNAIRFNHQRFEEYGIDHVFDVVEWAPGVERPWLLDLVADAVPSAIPRCRWWLVDPEYQRPCSLNPRLAYPEFLAKNVAIRRANARFLWVTNCDIYIGRVVLERLARQDLGPGVIYRAVRHDLIRGLDDQQLDWSLLEDSRNYSSKAHARLRPPLYNGATGDFVVLDSETFRQLRGFNEIYRLARIGVDVNFLVNAHSRSLPIEDTGGVVYHQGHRGSYRQAKKFHQDAPEQAPYGDERWGARCITYDNPPEWGLASAPERPVREGATWLDFDWRAVPPLAPLSRLGL